MFTNNIGRKVRTIYWYGAAIFTMLFALVIGQAAAQNLQALTTTVESPFDHRFIPCNWFVEYEPGFHLADASVTDGRATFIIVSNTSELNIPIRLILLRQDGSCTAEDYVVGRKPLTIEVHGILGMGDQKLSAKVVPLHYSHMPYLTVEKSSYWGPDLIAGTNVKAQDELTNYWYFAEGNYDAKITVFNPTNKPVYLRLQYIDENGFRAYSYKYIPYGPARFEIDVNKDLGGTFPHSTEIIAFHADYSGAYIAVEREITWNNGAEGTLEMGQMTRSRWYGAEGSKCGMFNTYLVVANFYDYVADLEIRFLHQNGGEYPVTVKLGKGRMAIEPPTWMPCGDFGYAVESRNLAQVVVERSMYWGFSKDKLWRGGHTSAGSSVLSQRWQFAEGTVGGRYHTFILLANPNDKETQVQVKLNNGNGDITHHLVLLPHGRTTVALDDLPSPSFKNTSVAAEVQSNLPIVAERSMYWLMPDGTIGGGHNSGGRVKLPPGCYAVDYCQ